MYYTLQPDKVVPPSPEALNRKDDWVAAVQREVPSEWEPIMIKVNYKIVNKEIEKIRKFFEGPVVEYWIVQKNEMMEGRPDSLTRKRARETLLWSALGYEVELIGSKVRSRKSTTDFTDTQEWHDFLETLRETEFEPNGYEFPKSEDFWKLAEKVGYDQAKEVNIDQLQKRMQKKMESPDKPKVYIFTKEVKRWGVEAGDYYDERRHMIKGGTEKLLEDGVIEEETSE